MAGYGPPPKDPAKRARTNKDAVQVRTLIARPALQPELPTRYAPKGNDPDDYAGPIDWPVATVEWWRMWGESPLAAEFTAIDWAELLLAAYLHAEFMEGNYKLAGELRLRTAKFGATPEDRLRLRIQFAQAIDAEVTAATKAASSRERFPGMRIVPEVEA